MQRKKLLETVIQPATEQQEKEVHFLPIEQVIKRPPLPWWVLLYFSNHTPILNTEEEAGFTNGHLNYYTGYEALQSNWFLTAYHINEDLTIDPYLLPVFRFPIPPTEEKFLQVMQVLDVQ